MNLYSSRSGASAIVRVLKRDGKPSDRHKNAFQRCTSDNKCVAMDAAKSVGVVCEKFTLMLSGSSFDHVNVREPSPS